MFVMMVWMVAPFVAKLKRYLSEQEKQKKKLKGQKGASSGEKQLKGKGAERTSGEASAPSAAPPRLLAVLGAAPAVCQD